MRPRPAWQWTTTARPARVCARRNERHWRSSASVGTPKSGMGTWAEDEARALGVAGRIRLREGEHGADPLAPEQRPRLRLGAPHARDLPGLDPPEVPEHGSWDTGRSWDRHALSAEPPGRGSPPARGPPSRTLPVGRRPGPRGRPSRARGRRPDLEVLSRAVERTAETPDAPAGGTQGYVVTAGGRIGGPGDLWRRRGLLWSPRAPGDPGPLPAGLPRVPVGARPSAGPHGGRHRGRARGPRGGRRRASPTRSSPTRPWSPGPTSRPRSPTPCRAWSRTPTSCGRPGSRARSPLASAGAVLLDLLSGLALLALLLALYGTPFTWALLALPVLLLVLLAATVGVSLLGAAVNVHFRDVKHALLLLLQVLFFLRHPDRVSALRGARAGGGT